MYVVIEGHNSTEGNFHIQQNLGIVFVIWEAFNLWSYKITTSAERERADIKTGVENLTSTKIHVSIVSSLSPSTTSLMSIRNEGYLLFYKQFQELSATQTFLRCSASLSLPQYVKMEELRCVPP